MSSDTSPEAPARRVETLEARVDELESTAARQADRLDELDAGLQAVRGFLGGVDAVNEAVERRADAAIAAVERLGAEMEIHDPDGPPLDVTADVDDDVERDTDDVESRGEATSPDSLRDRLRTLR